MAVITAFGAPALADTADTLADYIGYTIAAKKTIVGWVDEGREKKGEAFEGCQYGRVIIFDDRTYLKCAEYGYQYAYRPEAVLLVRSGRIVMIVEDDAYDMTQ
jgi:hypothetical protein